MGTDDRRKATGARPAADRTSHYTLERFSELIGSIYDCALDPKNWGPTLENINREFTFICSALGVIPLRSGGQIVNANAGIDSEWLARGDEYRADAVDMWGGAERMQRFPIDEPIVHSQAIGSARLIGNRYFHEIFEPRGIFDAVGITIAREPSLLGYLAFSRHSSAGNVKEAEVEGLRLLAPHFRRAVTISDLFDMKAIEAASFASALDSFSFGILLVDEALGIVHANRTAQAMLAARDPIRSEKGVLTLPVRSSEDALVRAVRQASRDETALGGKGIGIPARRDVGEPCVIHVLPLRRGEMRRGLAQRAAAVLFIAPAAAPPHMPSDALALLYDLTPAETRIFELIAAGKTQAAIAATLGIAPSTVKSHLLHLFAKTGCQRQADLLKLAASLSSPA